MRTYKEKDKRCEEVLEMLDFYYDADHPIESLVSKEKIDELITILREEYGIFYAPKETHSIMDTMEKYRVGICKAIGVEKVWCWSTTIEEVTALKRRYDNLLQNYNKLVEGGKLNNDKYVTIPRENYDILVEESGHLDWLMNMLEEDYCIHNFTSRDAFVKDMNSYVHYREELCLKEYELEIAEKTDNKSGLDLLFEELKKFEKEVKDDTKWKKNNIWLKSSITKSEESNGSIHNKVEFYIYHRSPEEDLTESFKYTVKQDGNGYFYLVCHNPYKKESDMSIPGILDYIKGELEETRVYYADIEDDGREEFDELVKKLEKLAEDKNKNRSDITINVNTRYKGTDDAKYNEAIVIITNHRDKKEYRVVQDMLGNFIIQTYPKMNYRIEDVIVYIGNHIDNIKW